MAQLTVLTHDEQAFRMPMRDDFQMKPQQFQNNDWIFILGSNGNVLILHTKNIASIYFEKDKIVA